MESVFISRFTVNNIAPKLQKRWTHKIAFKIIENMLKQSNFFYSQPSTLSKEALAKFYLSTTFGLSFINSVAPTRSSTFYAYLITKSETVTLKPDFHSHISLVASDVFRMRHAQSSETSRSGRKNIFRSVRIGSSDISTSAKFSYSETNQTSFLSHVDISRGLKNFHKMAAPQLYQA